MEWVKWISHTGPKWPAMHRVCQDCPWHASSMHLLVGGEDQAETSAGGQAHLEPSPGDARMVGIDVEQFDPERDRDGPHEVAWACLVCADALSDALHALHRSEPGWLNLGVVYMDMFKKPGWFWWGILYTSSIICALYSIIVFVCSFFFSSCLLHGISF